MRNLSLLLMIAVFLPACTSDWDPERKVVRAVDRHRHATTASSVAAALQAGGKRADDHGASLPDRGELLGYDRGRPALRQGAFTRYAVELSEEHAFRAARPGGEIAVPTPDGRVARFAYERSVEHADGNWSWIGRTTDGLDAVITFGEKAVFGSMSQADGEPLRLTTSAGRAWLVVTDGRRLLDGNRMHGVRRPDYLVPPSTLAKTAAAKARGATASTGPDTKAASVVVDVVLGFSTGFASSLGGTSQANTRLANLVDITNQAYANSRIDHRIRLVRTVAVNYADTTSNEDALEALTGYTCSSTSCTPISVPATLQPLRDARNLYGGDLVSLLRDFRAPQNGNCGIAWLIGGGGSGISSGNAPFGYSVSSHGEDLDEGDGRTYFCREETMTHELGHNMGQQHDVENSDDPGAHPYSYGYREASSTGFFTVMAYPRSDSSQFGIRHFANPAVTYAGRSTGVANSSDNAHSMNQTMPLVATFAPTVGTDPGSLPDLFAINRMGGSGTTEVHVLGASGNYTRFVLHAGTALGQTGVGYGWAFRLGDYDRDGVQDLYVVNKMGGSNTTEVHVLNGANRFASYLLHMPTALARSGSDNAWVFDLGDYNRDGRLDLYAIKRNGASAKTEVHVLNGADNFRSFLLHASTALASTGTDLAWRFEVGDYNRDGAPDLFAIRRNGASTTEVHVLDGANRFRTFLLQTATVLGKTGALDDWGFKLGDYDGDGALDLFAIRKQGTASTEVHVLDGAARFRSFSTHRATALQKTGTNGAWQFELVSR